MKIQPITTWFNGEPQTASNFTLRSIADDFTTSATLYYELQKEVVNEEQVSYENLVTANLDISGQDYKDWSATPDANTWIYNWAAAKLNIVLTNDNKKPVIIEPDVIAPEVVDQIVDTASE